VEDDSCIIEQQLARDVIVTSVVWSAVANVCRVTANNKTVERVFLFLGESFSLISRNIILSPTQLYYVNSLREYSFMYLYTYTYICSHILHEQS
jgi:hypothetical protein